MEQINVLDHGYVRLINSMGSDSFVANAARISYDKGTRPISDDRNLIRYLVRHKHTSPLEMCEFMFEIKAPLFIIQQFLRHRTANINQMSMRYSEAIDEYYIPSDDQIKVQSNTNKQGRGDDVDDKQLVKSIMDNSCSDALQEYKGLLDQNVSRELARSILPHGMYSKFVWKMDLHNLLHFLKLRMDHHAQYEIRVFANAIHDLIKPIVPICVEAWEDYSYKAQSFSRMEMEVLKKLLDEAKISWTPSVDDTVMSRREVTEFKEKLDL